MKARYSGWCAAGKHYIKQGELIEKTLKGWSHYGCATTSLAERAAKADEDGFYNTADLIRGRDDFEYRQGLGDGERYKAEKKVYGKALADKFQAMDEFNRFWKNGEDY